MRWCSASSAQQRILPYILLSIPAGIVADRFDRRLVLMTADIARGLIMLAIAAVLFAGGPIWIVVALAVVATCFSAFFAPAIGAYLPSLVSDESELGPANSAWSSLDNLAFLHRPGLRRDPLVARAAARGLPAQRGDVRRRCPGPVPPAAQPAERRHGGGDRRCDANRTRRRQGKPAPRCPALSGLALLNIATGFVFGGLGVITVILAVDVFPSIGEAGTGLFNSAIWRGWRRRRAGSGRTGPAPPARPALARRCADHGGWSCRPGRSVGVPDRARRHRRGRGAGRCCSRSCQPRCSSASCPMSRAGARSG